MIVISDITGQLGNRLIINAYSMALAEASGQRLVDLSLNEYRFLFPATRWRLPQQFHFALRKFLRALIKAFRRLPGTQSCFVKVGFEVTRSYSPTDPEFIASVKSRRFTFIEGLPDPSKVDFPSSDAIRAKFTPDASVMEVVREHIARARIGVDILVGLHIRRGDYALFHGGKYNYPASFYLQIMETMSSFFPNKKVAFLLCTNGTGEFNANAPVKIIPGPGKAMGALGDLHCLAECDYIIGAPSTFSSWAAFYGRKPVLQLVEPRLPSSLDEFMVPDNHIKCYDLKLSPQEYRRLKDLDEVYLKTHKNTLF